MDTPIYSDTTMTTLDEKMKRCVIEILSQNTIDGINASITVIKHGIYIFPQYKERNYIINGYAEVKFWCIASRLYVLFHDCGGEIVKTILDVVYKDGRQVFKPFEITPNGEINNFSVALEFIENIEILRHLEQHGMKPDSLEDKSKVQKGIKLLKKITGKDEPYSENDWERCISWLNSNSVGIYNLLKSRIDFIEVKASETQKENLIRIYYSSLEKYFEKNLYNIVQSVCRKNHRYDRGINIEAIIKIHRDDIIKEAIKLLSTATSGVDPFIAAVQATDTFMYKKKI